MPVGDSLSAATNLSNLAANENWAQIRYSVCYYAVSATVPTNIPCELQEMEVNPTIETKETIRRTVHIEKALVDAYEILKTESDTNSFSQFTSNALNMYIDYQLGKRLHPIISKEIQKAVRREVAPIASRLSKGLYRYAILIDMLCQILVYLNFTGGDQIMEIFRRNANIRIARMRGHIDLQSILDDTWDLREGSYDEDEDE